MADFYKHEIAKWNVATDDLTLEQEAAYSRVVGMIRLYERPFRHNLRVLSGMWRCNERKAKRILQELIDAGKLTIEDGFIIDEKAVEDASTLRQLRVDAQSSGRRGGIESGKSRRKLLENNDTDQGNPSTREEKRREEDSEANASDANASPEPNFREALFGRGVRFLTARGVSERSARSVIGRWLKDHDAGEVFRAFVAADKERPVEPVAWITARLGTPPPVADLEAIMATIDISGPHQ